MPLVEGPIPGEVIVSGEPERPRADGTGHLGCRFEQRTSDSPAHASLSHGELGKIGVAVLSPDGRESYRAGNTVERDECGACGKTVPPSAPLGHGEFMGLGQIEKQTCLLEEPSGVRIDLAERVEISNDATPQSEPIGISPHHSPRGLPGRKPNGPSTTPSRRRKVIV